MIKYTHEGSLARRIFGLFLGVALMGFLGTLDAVEAYGPNRPMLANVHASAEVRMFDTTHIYLRGSDPDGDLQFIHIWVEIPGASTTPIRLTIDPDQKSSISGYLQLNTMEFGAGTKHLFGWPIRILLTLEDRAGHQSETAEVSFAMYYAAKESMPPSGVFQQRFLGRIPGMFFVPGGGNGF